MKSLIKIFVLFFIIINLQAQRSLYVDNFNDILGNYSKEKELLEFADENNFNKLILYELHKVNKRLPLADTIKNKTLGKFIKLAKKMYNIKEVAGSGENGGFFINSIDAYNKSKKDSLEKFDVYNLEYEYWHPTNSLHGGYYCETYLRKNGIPCTREGSFNYYLETLSIMKLLAEASKDKILVEAYIGKYQKKEIERIIMNVDRLLVSAYAKTPKESFKNVKNRLKKITECKCKPEVSVIFSSEKEFMNGFIKFKQLKEIEKIFKDEMTRKIDKERINLIDFTYFKYSILKKAVNFEKRRRLGEYYNPE